eukprot:1014533_1
MNKIHLLLFTLLPVFAKKKADQTVWSKFAMEIDATTGNVKWNVELDTAATKAQFESIDTSKDGKIDEKEVFAKMKQMSQDTSTFKPSDLIGLGDKNKDGTIDFEEFEAMLPLTVVFNVMTKTTMANSQKMNLGSFTFTKKVRRHLQKRMPISQSI